MKRTIRLTESELRNVISESVRRVLKEEYDISAVKAKYAFLDNVDALKGILTVMNYWLHYAAVNSSGTNHQPYRASVITNYRNNIKECLASINDEALRSEVSENLKPLFAVQRGSFNEAITVIQQVGMPILQKYKELKSELANFEQ